MRVVRLLILVAVAGAWYAALPPRVRTLPPLGEEVPIPVRGVVHVHTNRSDGTGTMESVAAAAARAGLQFVVISDHGDAMRGSAPPSYRDGVLCIDAVEISTDGGHVVALGLPPAQYPLGGGARDVIDDVHRLGGLAIAAHPGSPKPALQWSDWSLPIDGLEWLNADSEWRDETRWSLVRVLFTFPFRARESLASLLDRPVDVLRRWDDVTRLRQVPAIAAQDAHARIGLRSLGEPYDSGATIHMPGYETMFRTFSLSLPGVRLTRDASADASTVIEALRRGHVYSTIDALAEPGWLGFTARSGRNSAVAGDTLALDGPVTLRVETRAPAGTLLSILRDGVAFRIADGTPLEETVPPVPAVYRVEVTMPGVHGDPPVPWMVSNPIYVGRTASPTAPPTRKAPAVFSTLYDNGARSTGTIEASEEATGALDVIPAVPGSQLLFRYALGGRLSLSPYVALVIPTGPDIGNHDRLAFTARASRPMRLAVQLRVPGGLVGERWQRTVYLDETPRPVTVYFDEMTPQGGASAARPVLSKVASVLFVVDTVHAALGSSGQVWLDDIRLAH